jgi:DNA repair exonuclease SbcCD ATPase subunit
MARGFIFKEIKKLETLKRKAIKRLLKAKEQIDTELSALGHGASAAVETFQKVHRMSDPTRICKVCGKKGHDGRSHRYERKTRKATA